METPVARGAVVLRVSMMQPTYIDEFTRPVSVAGAGSALVIVDMQNASGHRAYGLGRMLAEQGRSAEAEYRFARIERLLIPNIRRLASAFRAAAAPVIYLTYGCTLPDYADAPRHLKKWLQATRNRAGEPEHEIVAELRPEPGDLVLNKTTIGAFASTGLEAALRGMGVETIVVTGVSTNNCVGMTAMEAADRQFGVVLVDDATGTCSDAMQAATTATFRRLWGRVATTDEVIGELRAGRGARRAGAAG
ncbi:MAG: cysteine hydrolase [Steroidobacteraceae bacterium]|nr:cysteine hydrolase [Steroidobacteraceae bacterium]MCW5573143.1 cysteine hydrolase [Steroidobacteraceae bacterium]